MSDFRTKPTVQASITIDSGGISPDARFIEYQPGNGTRYQLILVSASCLGEKANLALGLNPEDNGVLVTFPLGGYKTIALTSGGYLSRSYVAEKIGTNNISDVAVLTELLAFLTDRRSENAGP